MSLDARHIVASSTGKRVLFGAFEHQVAVGDLATCRLTHQIETTFDFGGQRLALSDEMNGILAGAYHVHGLAFYSCKTGKEVWRRKDLKKVQNILLSRDARTAYCGREGASLAVVDIAAGEIVRSVPGARSLHESPYKDASFVDSAHPHLIAGRRHPIERTTFAILSAVFGPDSIALSEAGGPVRCLDNALGAERWRYCPQQGSHVLSLAYRETPPAIVGVEWPYENGGAKRLVQLSPKDGELLGAHDIGEPIDVCFALSGQVAVTSDGHVFDTRRGALRSSFDGLSRKQT